MNDQPPSPPGALRQVTAAAADAGERLDRLIARQIAELSRTRVKRLLEDGRVSLGGATIRDPSLKVRAGQSFVLDLPPPIADVPEPQAMDLTIRYEDAHLIVIDKPAGLVVHPAPGNLDHTLVNALLAHCGESLAGIGGVKRPGIVHRLDKDTSGLMVVAKTEAAQAALAADFAARRITRAYQALVWGVPSPRAGEIAGNIGRNPQNRKKMAVLRRGGKTAVTRYRVLRAFKDWAALLECRLATGRTHQIRVHLAAQGHPIIGDPTYGDRRSLGRLQRVPLSTRTRLATFPRQALHATELGFRHPATGEPIAFASPPPSDIGELISLLESLET